MTLIHVDTDLGSDTDDLCALAMLLGWPGVEISAITTTSDPSGMRGAYARYALSLVGRDDIPVAVGAGGSLAGFTVPVGFPDHWPEHLQGAPSAPGEALDQILASAERGATIVGIGPFTNLALLEVLRPGTLRDADVVLMGGWIFPPRDGLPPWGPGMDYNVQQDTAAARILFERCNPTWVPLPVSLETTLRAAHLPRLRRSGPLGQLIAEQGQNHATTWDMAWLGRQHPAVPEDILNFNYDALACAVAAGWEGVEIQELKVGIALHRDRLRFALDPAGKRVSVVTAVDRDAFEVAWLDATACLD